MAAVERGDPISTNAFRSGHDRGVGGPERKVAIAGDEFRNPKPVTCRDRLGDQVARGKITEETDFRVRSEPRAKQICDLGDHEHGHDERPLVGLQKFDALGMVTVVPVDVRVKGTRIDDQRD